MWVINSNFVFVKTLKKWLGNECFLLCTVLKNLYHKQNIWKAHLVIFQSYLGPSWYCLKCQMLSYQGRTWTETNHFTKCILPLWNTKIHRNINTFLGVLVKMDRRALVSNDWHLAAVNIANIWSLSVKSLSFPWKLIIVQPLFVLCKQKVDEILQNKLWLEVRGAAHGIWPCNTLFSLVLPYVNRSYRCNNVGSCSSISVNSALPGVNYTRACVHMFTSFPKSTSDFERLHAHQKQIQ